MDIFLYLDFFFYCHPVPVFGLGFPGNLLKSTLNMSKMGGPLNLYNILPNLVTSIISTWEICVVFPVLKDRYVKWYLYWLVRDLSLLELEIRRFNKLECGNLLLFFVFWFSDLHVTSLEYIFVAILRVWDVV